jgi:hypothetical protein
MGKNSVIKTLGKRIGNIVLHKLLFMHTNRPESKGHLESEELAYRDSAIKDARKYHWNDEDKKEIKSIAIEFIKNKRQDRYSDVAFSIDEVQTLVEEEIINLKL